jgi:hypothetical protein
MQDYSALAVAKAVPSGQVEVKVKVKIEVEV